MALFLPSEYEIVLSFQQSRRHAADAVPPMRGLWSAAAPEQLQGAEAEGALEEAMRLLLDLPPPTLPQPRRGLDHLF